MLSATGEGEKLGDPVVASMNGLCGYAIRRPWLVATLLLVTGGLGACSKESTNPAPPHATDAPPIPQENSFIAIPVEADQTVLLRAVEKAVPLALWTIDKKVKRCIPPKKVKVFGKRINVTPVISCTIVGEVTRGRIALRGEGRDIVADVPIQARITARDIGGVLKGETATGSALAHARIRLDIGANWRLRGTVRLSYGWKTPPGIDFLGQRITFTEKADARLGPIVRKLEADLPRDLARIDLKRQVEPLWRKSFATLELNERKPPVWMRVTPRRIVYSGYHAERGRLRLDLGLEALTETFIGPRPDPPEPTPLPSLAKAATDGRFRFFLPVIADYRELEPVLLRALTRRSQRPFQLPGIGPVMARFDKVVGYGTTGGRIAVGVDVVARPQSGRIGETRGTIWLAARPVNQPNSPEVHFENLTVTGSADGVAGKLLIALGSNEGVSSLLANSLTQNFTKDVDKLLGKVRRAIEQKQEGDFTINADMKRVEIGVLAAYGQGLYLPVRAEGDAKVRYQPKKR